MQQFHTKGRENSGNYACSPPFHEPFPLLPSCSPSGGEGARRAVEGDSDRFMASIHVRILEVFPFHEPTHPWPLPGGELVKRAPTLAPLLRRGWGWVHGPYSRPILEVCAYDEPSHSS